MIQKIPRAPFLFLRSSFSLKNILLSGNLSANAQNKIINQPSSKLAESDLALKTIIQTDTATILCFRVNCIYRPLALHSTIHLKAKNKDYAYRYGKLVTKKDNQFIDSPFTPDSTNTSSHTQIGDRHFFDRDSLVLCFDRIQR